MKRLNNYIKKKKKILFKIILIIVCFLLVITIFAGCSIKTNYSEIWTFTQNYIRNQLKIYTNENLSFPPLKSQDFIRKLGNNKFEIKSYVAEYKGGCCGSYKRRDFTLIVQLKDKNYNVLSFEINN